VIQRAVRQPQLRTATYPAYDKHGKLINPNFPAYGLPSFFPYSHSWASSFAVTETH